MPKKFIYKIDDEVQFEAPLKSQRCEGTTKANARCKRTCVIGLPYCWTHLKTILKLKIKTSTIPNSGDGVFVDAGKVENGNRPIFKEGDIITEYKGETINDTEKQRRYGNKNAPYTAYKKNGVYEDGAINRGIGSMINRADNVHPANAELSYNARLQKLNIKARKNIKNNEEILMPYGNRYAMNEQGVSYKTTKG